MRIDPSGYDAGKKIRGKKRPILVDTLGLILVAHVHPASIQHREGALPLLKEARRLFPFIERLFADGGYQGPATAAAVQALGAWRLEVVKRSDPAKGFVVLAKRWIVERTSPGSAAAAGWPRMSKPSPGPPSPSCGSP